MTSTSLLARVKRLEARLAQPMPGLAEALRAAIRARREREASGLPLELPTREETERVAATNPRHSIAAQLANARLRSGLFRGGARDPLAERPPAEPACPAPSDVWRRACPPGIA